MTTSRQRRHRFKSTRVGPINSALKRFKLPTCTPDTTKSLSFDSSLLFSWRVFTASSLRPLPPGHKPLPPLLYRWISPASILCRSFPVPGDAKCTDVAFHAVGPLLLFPTPPPLHSTCYHPEHNPLWQPVVMRVIDHAFINLFVRTVVSTPSHPVSPSAQLYERMRWSGFRLVALRVSSKIRW